MLLFAQQHEDLFDVKKKRYAFALILQSTHHIFVFPLPVLPTSIKRKIIPTELDRELGT